MAKVKLQTSYTLNIQLSYKLNLAIREVNKLDVTQPSEAKDLYGVQHFLAKPHYASDDRDAKGQA